MNSTLQSSDPCEHDPQVLLVQQLFVQEISNLRGMLWGLVPNHHRLDDIVQETFLTATRKAADFKPGTNFRAWLFTIARFKVLHSLRQSPMERALSLDLVESMIAETEEPDAVDDRLIHLRECIERLGENARSMLDLRYSGGLSIADVADRMGRRVNSVKVMLSRTRSLLRNCIEKRLSTIRTEP